MHDTTTIPLNSISKLQLYGILTSTVIPRPIGFVSTVDKDGNVNLSPFSFFNVVSADPPIIIFSPVIGFNGEQKDTYRNIKEVPEAVINLVNYPIVEQMSLSSTAYDKEINEFEKAGLTAVKSDKIRPPRVAESPVSFECTIEQTIELGETLGAGNLILAKVKLIHIKSKYLTKDGKIDQVKLDMVGRMGGNDYTRINEQSVFQIKRPHTTIGIGIDKLPSSIKHSPLLTGNHLGKLGTVEVLPTTETVNQVAQETAIKMLLSKWKEHPKNLYEALYNYGRQLLDNHQTNHSLAVLMYAENIKDYQIK